MNVSQNGSSEMWLPIIMKTVKVSYTWRRGICMYLVAMREVGVWCKRSSNRCEVVVYVQRHHSERVSEVS